jgi:AraC family transcriptional regulator of adaptative response/methylated-DNA-[protein]-cysteine methyltransferase
MTQTEADPRWARVKTRDKTADGRFVYAVRTTGIFCKPSCPARAAKPENVTFYHSAAQAEAAGYRACLRCRPTSPAAPCPATARIEAVAGYIRAHAGEPLPLARLAEQAGLSPFHLQRSFSAMIGVSPKAYQAAERLRAFKAGLRAGTDVLGATFEAGYGSTSRIYEQVDGGLGMTPSAYRSGGAGQTITHATMRTALGPLLMAATARGVCFVQFGDSAATLETALRAEYPNARLARAAADAPLAGWVRALDNHLSRNAPRPDLKLELRGTAFQIRVWRFLLSVKPGDTVSYTAIAAAAGAANASRAAGSACAANRIAVLIPCHRALRADGTMGGYRWGLERKQTLLALERSGAAG